MGKFVLSNQITSLIAAIIPSGDAIFLPAISNAVPCPGEVLTISKPIVILTVLSPATVFGVATFYAQFSLEPKGKYEIKVCDGTACHVRGSMPVLNAIRNKLNLNEGQLTSENGLFSLETVSCLGACGLAPVVVINEKVYPQMTSDAISIVLDTIMKEEA